MSEVALVPMPHKCLLLPEVLQAELTDVKLVQVVELLRVGRVVPGEDLILAQIYRLHNNNLTSGLQPCLSDPVREVFRRAAVHGDCSRVSQCFINQYM